MKTARTCTCLALLLLPSFAHAQVTATDGAQDSESTSELLRAQRDRRAISLSGEAGRVDIPNYHSVSRGDTLWDITHYYFGNPWQWPSLWSINPQIANPHWIFPGDQVRLRRDLRTTAVSPGVVSPLRTVPPQTVFQLSDGFLDPQEAETAGTVVGSPHDHMLLTQGDEAYVEFPRRTPRVGERFAVYQDAQDGHGDRNTGHVVRVIGTMEITRWDNDRRLATARLTEALDSIERGERVASIPRSIQVIPPVTNTVNLEGRIAALLRPRTFVGQHQVVFIDRGREDRVALGNRFLAVRRGDAWRDTLQSVSERTASGTGLDRDGDGRPDSPPGAGQNPDGNMPDEVVGELLVVEVRARTCTAFVTSATVELGMGERVVLRRGY